MSEDLNSTQLSKDDAVIRNALQHLEQHITNMAKSGQTVERINEELAKGYITGSARAFNEKINLWVEKYREIMRSFQHLLESTEQGSRMLDRAEDEAADALGGWGIDDPVTHVLSGRPVHA